MCPIFPRSSLGNEWGSLPTMQVIPMWQEIGRPQWTHFPLPISWKSLLWSLSCSHEGQYFKVKWVCNSFHPHFSYDPCLRSCCHAPWKCSDFNQSFHMRFEPLDTIQGLATGWGYPTQGKTHCWTPSQNMEFYLGVKTSWEYAGHRNPEDEEECDIVQLWSGYQACINSSGAPGNVPPAIGRGGDIQVNSAVFMFDSCPCLGELSYPWFQTRFPKVAGHSIVSRNR